MKLLEVENISFRYPTGVSDVFNGVSLTLDEGEVLSILGPNGAGKSTLLDCIANLQTPASGMIRLMGRDIRDMKPPEFAGLLGYVPQIHTPAFGYTVLDFVTMGRAPKIGMFQKPGKKDLQLAYDSLNKIGISHLAHKPYTEISGGERQQATIARVLCQQPKVILFDEPTAHLDYGNQHRILRLICRMADAGYAVVITTHNPDHALLLHGRVAILDNAGKLWFGDSDEIMTEEQLRDLYCVRLRLLDIPEVKRTVCISPRLKERE